MMILDEIKRNFDALLKRVDNACQRVGRKTEDIIIVAIVKSQPSQIVRMGFEAGVRIFGENRVQETKVKWSELTDIRSEVQLHLVGHLQKNKARDAILLYDVIESVDDIALANELSRRLEVVGRGDAMPVLIEVNTSGEETKYGVNPYETISLLEQINELPNLEITGLMTVGPYTRDEKKIRRAFSTLRSLGERATELLKPKGGLFHLSMGMTDDFEIAIEEGATIIRIGRAIFDD
ncbi:MAG: YggS family pyridoxal phosphate-dependent enzyme [bacterium]